MGHRALVAYERTDDRYSVHYSHWEASDLKLKHRITAETPFGGGDTDSEWAQELLTELAQGLKAAGDDSPRDGSARDSTAIRSEQRPSRQMTLGELGSEPTAGT